MENWILLKMKCVISNWLKVEFSLLYEIFIYILHAQQSIENLIKLHDVWKLIYFISTFLVCFCPSRWHSMTLHHFLFVIDILSRKNIKCSCPQPPNWYDFNGFVTTSPIHARIVRILVRFISRIFTSNLNFNYLNNSIVFIHDWIIEVISVFLSVFSSHPTRTC